MPDLIHPHIHLNGTSPDELLRQFTDVASALREALEKIQSAAPDARDYYPLGNEAAGLAAKQHARQREAVEGVLREFELMALAVFNADQS
jgi:hypothetical protein